MSGVEVAGLALAVLPLVISAAEYNILNKAHTLASKKARINQQLSFYHELYEELSLSTSNLNNLIHDVPSLRHHTEPMSIAAKWQLYASGEIEDALKVVLGLNYEPFSNILERLLKSVENIVSDKSLDLKEADAVSVPGVPIGCILNCTCTAIP